jgi:hypothetical protein
VIRQSIAAKPVIAYFRSNKTVLRNGGYYTLSWDVRLADVLELYKNGGLYKIFADEKKYQAGRGV